jgi:hypothetical protein
MQTARMLPRSNDVWFHSATSNAIKETLFSFSLAAEGVRFEVGEIFSFGVQQKLEDAQNL